MIALLNCVPAVFHLCSVCHTCAVYVADVSEKWIITVRG